MLSHKQENFAQYLGYCKNKIFSIEVWSAVDTPSIEKYRVNDQH